MVKDPMADLVKSLAESICILDEHEEVYIFEAWNPRNRDEAENIIGWHLEDSMCEDAGTRLNHLVPFAVAIRDKFEDLTIESSVLRSIEEESRYVRVYFYDRITDLIYRCAAGELSAMGPISAVDLQRICSFGRHSRVLVG